MSSAIDQPPDRTLGWIAGTLEQLGKNMERLAEEAKESKAERREDLREMKVWLTEEFERFDTRVSAVEGRTKILEDARTEARGFLGGLRAVWAFVLALPAGIAAGFFGGQYTK